MTKMNFEGRMMFDCTKVGLCFKRTRSGLQTFGRSYAGRPLNTKSLSVFLALETPWTGKKACGVGIKYTEQILVCLESLSELGM